MLLQKHRDRQVPRFAESGTNSGEHARSELKSNGNSTPTQPDVSGHVLIAPAIFKEDTQQHAIWAPESSTVDVATFHSQLEDITSESLLDRIFEDHRNYYSTTNLTFLGLGFGLGAISANTSLDADIHQHFNKSVTAAPTDEWAEGLHSPKNFGDGLYTLPVFAAAWGIGKLFDDAPLGEFSSEWGERSLRAFLVGAPPVILMQQVTGAGRPEEGDSHWHFWQDNNGVSGHSFMGALPFLTAAQTIEEPIPKALLYAASAAVPLSRVADGDHYASQALLGWWMAWSATMAVDATQDQDANWRTMPLLGLDFSGIGFEIRW